MLELEKTYLAKYLPEWYLEFESKEIHDIYVPENVRHPILRLRKSWDKYEITKKEKQWDDAWVQLETTISLSRDEYLNFAEIRWKRVTKIRYYMDYWSLVAEIDVFKWALAWLVLVDFEFKDEKTKDEFIMPDFCLADVTQEEFIAWWIICGKIYQDIESDLHRYDYKKL
jgi:adenylate cyclase